MHEESLTQPTKCVFNALSSSGLTKSFYLAGGTALALHYGHRYSADLDWFSESFDHTPEFRAQLAALGKLDVLDESAHTFHGVLDGVEISFFQYPYKLIRGVKLHKGVNIASEEDIACMKLDAIATRGAKRDFIDLYFILEKFTLDELINWMKEKYVNLDYNNTHLLRSLLFFDDAEEMTPKNRSVEMIHPVTWNDMKRVIESKVRGYMKEL